MRNPNKTASKASGTTLVELLVYIALVSIGLTAVYSVLISNIKTYDSIENSMVMHQDLRSALNMMIKEIRRAGCNPEASAGVGFQNNADDRYDTDADSIHFTTDLAPLNGDADGLTTGISEDVGYYLENNILYRRARYNTGQALQAQPLVENVNNFTLSYFKRDGTTTAGSPPNINDIWFVHIVLEGKTGRQDRITGEFRTEQVESRVRVRNHST